MTVAADRVDGRLTIALDSGDAPIGVFRRGGRIVIALARDWADIEIDRIAFALAARGLLSSIETRALEGGVAIALREAEPLSWALRRDELGARLELGRAGAIAASPPPPTELRLPDHAVGLLFEDEVVGDRVFVATAPQGRHFAWGAARFADVELFDALIGAAFAPLADGVEVLFEAGEWRIVRGVGARAPLESRASAALGSPDVALPTTPDAQTAEPSDPTQPDDPIPSEDETEVARSEDAAPPSSENAPSARDVVEEVETGRSLFGFAHPPAIGPEGDADGRALLDIARARAAADRTAETRALAREVGENDPAGGETPRLQFVEAAALWSAASILRGDTDAARIIEDYPRLADDPEAPVWRAAAAALDGRWSEAAEAFERARPALERYPLPLRRRLLWLELRALEHVSEPPLARARLAELRALGPPPGSADDLALYEARLLLREGAPTAARDVVLAAELPADRFEASHLRFERTLWLRESGELSPRQAVRALRAQSIYWPGHPREAEFAHAFATALAETGSEREALALWRRTLARLPEAAERDAMRAGMREAYFGAIERAVREAGEDPALADAALEIVDGYPEIEDGGARAIGAMRALAERLALEGRHDDAIALVRRLLARSSPDVEAVASELGALGGSIELAAGRPDRAVRMLERTAGAPADAALAERRADLLAAARLAVRRAEMALRRSLEGGASSPVDRTAERALPAEEAEEKLEVIDAPGDAVDAWRAALVDGAAGDADAPSLDAIERRAAGGPGSADALLEETETLTEDVDALLSRIDRELTP